MCKKLVILLIVTLQVCYVGSEIESRSFAKRFAIKIKEHDQDNVFQGLQQLSCRMVYQVTPQSFIFEYLGSKTDINQLITQIKSKYVDEVSGIEKIIVYTDYLLPGDTVKKEESLRKKPSTKSEQHYYGMYVPKAWANGYTGKGVVVALTDVGIHTNILDLKQNIYEFLCYNFYNDSSNVAPEVFHILPDIMSSVTSHGDYCAGLIASVFGNGVCTCGIAYNASIVAYKIFNITLIEGKLPVTSTGPDIISRALVRKLSEIDIFSNSWSPKDPFSTLHLLTKEAIRYGAEKGRRGLGTIYVFPAGQPGNGYSNNIYTIPVNGIGRNWTIPSDSHVSANVMTCGLAEGSNITAKYMKTVGTRDRCITSFGGVSAATAQVSAVIALALEANRNLTLREVQHLLIQASEPVYTEGSGFSPNGAGIFYHSNLGFGLLNAEKLGILAAKSKAMPPRLNIIIKETRRETSAKEVGVNFCYECDVLKDETCLNVLEHVMVEVRLKTWSIPLRIVLISPSGTKSVLVNYTSTQKKEANSAVWFTSVHFWNESAFGIWRLVYTEIQPPVDGNDFQPLLTLYGTRQRTSNQTNRSNNICDKRKRDTGKTTSFIQVTFSTDTRIKKTSTAESSATSIFTEAVNWFKNSPVNIVFPVLLGIFAPLLCVFIQKKLKFCIISRRLPAGEQNSSKVCLMDGSEFIQTIE